MRGRRRDALALGNPHRRLWTDDDPLLLAVHGASLPGKIRYTENPHHKRRPGDFRLTPPAQPRQNATLCDEAAIIRKSQALALLRSGIRAGLISKEFRGDFPTQIWAVSADDVVFEARLENETLGHYHGYPLSRADPFRLVVLDRARRSARV